jgi:tetratricopeptide (TPR) repeat protein
VASSARAEDVVRLATEHGSRAVRGEILDYTGETMSIQVPSGQTRQYPSAGVVEIETTWNDAHRAGRDAYNARDYRAAAGQLLVANRQETRVWARRVILTELMQCYEAAGQLEQAGDTFLAIVASDGATPAFAVAPIAWFPTTAVRQAKAEAWLASDDQPAAVLLGASYLQSTSSAAVARAALAKLVNHPNRLLASLAEAQLWRGEVFRATPADVDRWAARVEQMPEALRAGPYFVLGQTYGRLGQVDDAALAYLRVPVLFGERRELAARSLLAAARLAKRAGQRDETMLLCQEVVADFPDTLYVDEATELMKPVQSN